jgi:hypothetical protein
MPGNSDYPPAFSNPSISSTVGQVNDFAGNASSSSMRSVGGASSKAAAAFGNVNLQAEEGIPVVITGSRPPMSAHFPGLREAMLGSAIFQLAEQLPDTPDLAEIKKTIKELALDLHLRGGETIVKTRRTKRKKA